MSMFQFSPRLIVLMNESLFLPILQTYITWPHVFVSAHLYCLGKCFCWRSHANQKLIVFNTNHYQ